MAIPSRQELEVLYAELGSVSAVGRRFGKSHNTAKYWFQKRGVEIKGSGFRSPKSVTHFGQDAPNWKGGEYRDANGYIRILVRDHPSVAHKHPRHRYVRKHRLVMEEQLGRYLTPGEDVHHINEVKDDNRPENLELTSRSPHMVHHKADAPRDDHGRFAVA